VDRLPRLGRRRPGTSSPTTLGSLVVCSPTTSTLNDGDRRPPSRRAAHRRAHPLALACSPSPGASSPPPDAGSSGSGSAGRGPNSSSRRPMPILRITTAHLTAPLCEQIGDADFSPRPTRSRNDHQRLRRREPGMRERSPTWAARQSRRILSRQFSRWSSVDRGLTHSWAATPPKRDRPLVRLGMPTRARGAVVDGGHELGGHRSALLLGECPDRCARLLVFERIGSRPVGCLRFELGLCRLEVAQTGAAHEHRLSYRQRRCARESRLTRQAQRFRISRD
jgi:hypothetical protein